MDKLGVLLCIPDDKLELVAQPVILGHLLGQLSGVGREKNHVVRKVLRREQDDPKYSVEMRAVGPRRQHPDLGLVRKASDLFESTTKLLRSAPVDLLIRLARAGGR